MTTTELRRFYFDLETDGFLENVTVIHSLVLEDMDTGEVIDCADQDGYVPIDEGIKLLSEAGEICGHNIIGYDIPVIEKLYPEWTHSAKVTDTLILARLLFGEMREIDFNVRNKQINRNQTPTLPGQLIGTHKLEAWGFRLGAMKGDYSYTVKDWAKKYAETGSLVDIPDEYHALADTTAKGKPTLNPWKAWNVPMQDYCVQDVAVTRKLHKMLANKFDLENEWAQAVDIEHRFADVIGKQERHGFRFDEDTALTLAQEIALRKAEAEEKLFDLFEPWWVGLGTQTPKATRKVWVKSEHGAIVRTVKKETGETYLHTFKNGNTATRKVKVKVQERGYYHYVEEGVPFTKVELRVFNPGSRQQIEDRLRKLYGWQPQEFTPSGQAKIDDDILSNLSYPPAQSLAEYFMLDKRLGQLSDGKQAWLKSVKKGRIHGRVNTLGAVTGRCTHSNPNVAQVPSIENAKGRVPYGAECRALFQPDVGHVLIGCDGAGLELRCLAHFMRDGGRYANIVLNGKKEEGTDIHTMNQKAAGLPSRSNAKTFIYAFLYGAGNEKIGSIVAPNASPDEQSRQGAALKKKFLKGTPGLSGLIKAVKASAKKNGWVRGIDGRKVPIRHQHAALNSLLQNAGAIAMKLSSCLFVERMIAEGYVWGKDFAQVAHIHDEMQISCRPDLADYAGEVAEWSIAEAGRQLDFKCPLEGEAITGTSWKDTH